MATCRVPVVIWQDFAGFFSVCPAELYLDRNQFVAVDTDRHAALEQTRDYLAWLSREYQLPTPDFQEPKVHSVRVTVRPGYEVDGRPYPCDEEIELRLPCVQGRQENGMLTCSLPTLGLQFYFHKGDRLQTIVAEKVRQELAHRTPQQLSRYLPPQNVWLDEVFVRLPRLRGWKAEVEPLPALQAVAQPLADSAMRKAYSPPYQRDLELAELVRRLSQEKANVLLVGEHGVGKSALLVAAARSLERRAAEADADSLSPRVRHRYWSTTASRLVAGMKYLGQWEERCEQLVAELSRIGGVLCVESLPELLVQGGREPRNSLAAFLLPYLQEAELRMVAECAPSELDACRRLLPGLTDVFQVLAVPELRGSAARQALSQLAEAAGRETHVEIDSQAPATVCRLFSRFLPYRPLPGHGARFLAQTIRQAQKEPPAHKEQCARVESSRVVHRFLRETGLPPHLLDDDQPLDFATVVRSLEARVVGQPDACRAVARTIMAFKAGLNDPRRPLGVFLFCGPTGVGKTQLAKTLAHELFEHGDDTDRLLRLDMSEYALPGAAERLITKPDGTPSDFTARMRQQPLSVVLLDEIEKASPQVFDVLLGVLDEGRLNDRYGRTTRFESAILIMTSNLGASEQRSVGFSGQSAGTYEREVRSFFRPEFCNRIDAVVTFQPLMPDACAAIVRRELEEVSSREGFCKSRLRLEFTPRLVDYLVRSGFHARYGARPLQRILERTVVTELSKFLVSHVQLRDALLRVDLDDNGERVSVSAKRLE